MINDIFQLFYLGAGFILGVLAFFLFKENFKKKLQKRITELELELMDCHTEMLDQYKNNGELEHQIRNMIKQQSANHKTTA